MQDSKGEFQIGVPDPSFRLSEAERATLLPDFDATALERLLSMYPPERRADLLKRFQASDDGWARLVIRLGHPALQGA